MDQSGNNKTAGMTLGTCSISGANLRCPYTSVLTFPSGSIPTYFTLFFRARYTPGGSNQGRIFQSSTFNFLLGWYYQCNQGVAYFNTWMTVWTGPCDRNWGVATGRNSNIGNTVWWNGVPVSNAVGGQGGGVLTIGSGSTDVADADVSEVRIFDFWLPDSTVNSINAEMLAHVTAWGLYTNPELNYQSLSAVCCGYIR